MANHPNLAVTRAGATSVITLNRVRQRNAITLDMWHALRELVTALGEKPDTRSIIITGAGGNFSAGADIREFATVRQSAAAANAYEEAVDACCDALATVAKPTFAAVSGFCLGGACHLAMSADFRVADATAIFGIPAARMSIVYGVRASQKLLALVGLAQAKRMLYFGQHVGANEAEHSGLVDHFASSAFEAACELSEVVNANAPLSIVGAKTILNALAMGTGGLDMNIATALIERAADSADFVEGRRAFEERRPPRFAGR